MDKLRLEIMRLQTTNKELEEALKEMNEALAECAIATSKRTNERKKKPAPMLSPQQEWFFGI